MAREVTVRWLSGMQTEAEVGAHQCASTRGSTEEGTTPGRRPVNCC